MHLYQSAPNTKVNVNKTTVIKCGSPQFQPPTGYYHSPPGEVFRHLGILFTDKGITLREIESKLLSNLVNRMSKWKYKLLDLEAKVQAHNIFVYSKLWYAAHIVLFTKTFEKKVDTITRTFIWGSLQQVPIGLQHLYPPKKSGGLGLQQVVVKAKHMWAKGFLDSIEVYFCSPALGRAFNMVVSVSDEPFNTISLRMWMLKHKKLHTKNNCPPFWKEVWRTLQQEKWSINVCDLSRDNKAKLKAFDVFFCNTKANLEKGRVSIEIMKTK
ncbi:hypothetical protein DSO57_1034162 [Entomophthora muscae]|uniref:Uncharacterized protein n=1 Tax=Entomophthora muscae TaxID=34485 RepID=A0ACC2S257_9FUNG|nr:hypothetical protein DSO57_1034162 [Entomophthora muscae]